MGTVHPFATHQPFDPVTCEAMGVALDNAWQELLASGSKLATSVYANATKEALALHIVELARRGERDVNRLRDDAVAFVLDALSLAQEPEAALAMEPEAQSLAAVNFAPTVRHGCRSAGLARPLASSPAARSGVRPNQCPIEFTRDQSVRARAQGVHCSFSTIPRHRCPAFSNPEG